MTQRCRSRSEGCLQVVDAKGQEMNQGETVTMFNDMCLLAPATLISRSIRWEEIDSVTVKGFFSNQGNTVSAVLTFDPSGALRNFVSNDRYLSEDGKTYLSYPWSTPVGEYGEFGGRKIAAGGEAIWHMPRGGVRLRPVHRREVGGQLPGDALSSFTQSIE